MTEDRQDKQAVVIAAFLAFLDERQVVLEHTLEQLNALRAAVIRRDEETLERLLEQTRQDALQERELAQRQCALERQLVAVVDGLSLPLTLTGLCRALDEPLRSRVEQTQQALRRTAERVQREYESTDLLLRQCARCNRRLLDAILGRSPQSLTYNAQGQSRQDTQGGLVSMKF